jgi:hypothetical protein
MKTLIAIGTTLCTLSIFATGCVATGDTQDDEDLRGDPDSVISSDGKADGFFESTTLFANALSQTKRVASKSTVAHAVSFTVTGAQSFTTDGLKFSLDAKSPNPNRAVGEYSLSTQIWQFRNSVTHERSKDGFQVSFVDIVSSGFGSKDPFRHGIDLDLFVPTLRGPGDYNATGTLLMSSKRNARNGPVEDGAKFAANNCRVSVPAAGADNAIRGSFSCTDMTGPAGKVSVTGTFVAPDTSMRNSTSAFKR